VGRAGGAAIVALALLLAGTTTATAPDQAVAAARPFGADSPFNVRIPRSPSLDPQSKAMVARATRTRRVNANLVEFGVPIYEARPSTPTYEVSCGMTGIWGSCPFTGRRMPVPDDAEPSPGSDGALVVVDRIQQNAGEYWRAARSDSGWTASWGAVNPLTGSGWGGASTGAGASRLAGVVRMSEIKAGRIEHALVLQSDNVCRGVVRPPAVKTDGRSTRADCLPEGTRLQLSPAVKVAKLSGITPGERAVARALQLYGGYVIDRGGAPLSVSFEVARDATASSPGAVYRDAGLTWDYYGMPHVPWRKLRVLRTWRG